MGTRLETKTTLVTGATSNIGRSVATAFAAEGAQVVVSGRNEERGAAVVDQIRAGGRRAHFVAANLDGSARESSVRAAEATRLLGGHIEVLVNNAAIFPPTTTATTDEATVDEVYAVNVKAPFFLTAAIAPAMVEQGGCEVRRPVAAAGPTLLPTRRCISPATNRRSCTVIDVDGGRVGVAVIAVG